MRLRVESFDNGVLRLISKADSNGVLAGRVIQDQLFPYRAGDDLDAVLVQFAEDSKAKATKMVSDRFSQSRENSDGK